MTRSPFPLQTAASQALNALPRASFTALKVIAFAIFLLNARSWPLLWHWRVLIRPVVDIRIPYYRFVLSTIFLSKRERVQKKADWLARLCPVGEDPISFEVVEPGWAGPDDCDFNWHLSNSCYPKALDSARFRAALRICPTFFRAGGWLPLAATHFRFVKEIPMFAHYEMRMNLAAWDEKWMYVLVRYVTPAKKGKGKNLKGIKETSSKASDAQVPLPSGDSAPFPSLHTPGSALVSEAPTPFISRSSSLVGMSGLSAMSPLAATANGNGKSNGNGTAHAAGDDKPSLLSGVDLLSLVPTEEPDGATLHCVSVSELCFKIGRITVPPAVVLGLEGFHRLPTSPLTTTTTTTTTTTSPAPSATDKPTTATTAAPARYTYAHPPPTFLRALALQTPEDLAHGHLRTLQRFLREGWRDVPAGERWWEDALGGEIEEKRRVNLERIRGVREGMFGAAAALR